jgi:hypothetical protein
VLWTVPLFVNETSNECYKGSSIKCCQNAADCFTVPACLSVCMQKCENYVSKLSQWQNSIKFSRADSCIRRFIKSHVLETDSVSIIPTLMVETESVSETSDFINPTPLFAWENFTECENCCIYFHEILHWGVLLKLDNTFQFWLKLVNSNVSVYIFRIINY